MSGLVNSVAIVTDFFMCAKNRCFSVQQLSFKPYFVYFLWVNIFTHPYGQDQWG